MIQHIVMLKLPAGHDTVELQAIMDGLGDLRSKLAGFKAFAHGPNRDFERKSADYPYGFICGFDDADAVEHYAKDPGHAAFGARLVALCTGGAEGIMVMDIEVASEREAT